MTKATNRKKPTERDNAVAVARKEIRRARRETLEALRGRKNNILQNESAALRDTVTETRCRVPNTHLLGAEANDSSVVRRSYGRLAAPKKSAVNPSAISARGGKNRHKGEQSAPSPNDTDSDVPLIGTEESEQIRELQRQLNEEREKNRILSNETAKQSTVEMIPRPKGKYNLMRAMRLDPSIKDDKVLYNDIRASVRQLIYEGRLDFGLTTKYQSLTKMGNIARAARELEPYLARFENDWATDVIIRQYINGKRKNETVKAKSSLKRLSASTTQNVRRKRARLDADVGASDRVGDGDERNDSSPEQHDSDDDDIDSSEWERKYGNRSDEDEGDESDD